MRIAVVIVLLAASAAFAQEGSGGAMRPRGAADSNIVFQSPRPLIELANGAKRNTFGVDILFSNYGYGAGMFFRKPYSEDLAGIATFFISGARSGDEFDSYDPYTDSIIGPPGKINRLYIIPFAVGVQYRLFSESITETFRPYVGAGGGPAVLIAAPYQYEFFTSIGHASLYAAPDLYVDLGVNFGNERRSTMGIDFRYYYIPFPRGLESIKGRPITDFGGFFISAHFGWQM